MLKDQQVRALKPKDKRYSLSDGQGLSIEVMPTGKKSWVVTHEKLGKRTRTKIGEYPILSLKDAREKSQELQRQSIMGYSEITVGELIEEWLAVYSKTWTSQKYHDNVVYRLNLVTESIRPIQANNITRNMVSTEIGKILANGTIETANRCLRLITAVFDYALAKEYVQSNPCAMVSKMIPTRKVENMPSLPITEMPKFWTAIDYMDVRYDIKQALVLYNYLACRPGELMKARWDTGEFDLENRVWLIPANRMKMRLEHMIYLDDKPLEILKELYANRIDDGFVFKNHSKPWLHMPTETPLAVIKRAGYNGKMTTHGFRALLSTNANEARRPDGSRLFDKDVIERHLAHVPRNKGRAAYNRAKYWDQRVELMQWWSSIVTPWIYRGDMANGSNDLDNFKDKSQLLKTTNTKKMDTPFSSLHMESLSLDPMIVFNTYVESEKDYIECSKLNDDKVIDILIEEFESYYKTAISKETALDILQSSGTEKLLTTILSAQSNLDNEYNRFLICSSIPYDAIVSLLYELRVANAVALGYKGCRDLSKFDIGNDVYKIYIELATTT